MRFRALSNDYGINSKRNYALSIIIGILLVIVLLFLFMNLINRPDFEPLSILWILIPYSVLAFPNGIFMIISSAQIGLIKEIGHNRHIILNKDELMLEDNIDGRSFIRCSYPWESIENIIVRNVTPCDKLNKNKISTITFVINQAEYDSFMARPRYKTPKQPIDSFFTVQYNEEIMDEIQKYWQGTIEELPNKTK